ncbi:MAG: P-II family nitrogen regulator [Clostridia bacterium]|nr:P-II family nitrogen regulator [Clostridia bacterium]
MSELYLMVTVAERARLTEFIKLYKKNRLAVNFISLGYGTATNEVLDFLGLDENEKAVCFSVVTKEIWETTKTGLLDELYIGSPGTGVAFTVPMSSVGGKKELDFLTHGQNFEQGEESVMQNTDIELIVAVCNQGYNENVMDAARAAGAAGGTVLHARGTGMESAEKFLGISLAAEKDMVMIVTKTERKNEIMRAIMEKAGLNSKAKSIVFSLPVSDTAGLRFKKAPQEPAAE